MAASNLEVARRISDAVGSGDLERVMENVTDEFEMDWSNSIGLARGVYRGRAEIRQLWNMWMEAFAGISWDLTDPTELDDSRLIVVNRTRVQRRGSGVEVRATGGQLWVFEGDKARSIKLFQSRAEALEAVGA